MKLSLKAWHKGKAASNAPESKPAWRKRLSELRGKFSSGETIWLLITWDVAGMEAALVRTGRQEPLILATASSPQGRFSAALDEVMQTFRVSGLAKPRRVALAARHMLPAVADLPVQPDKPRQPAQMRELIQPELEPALAEFGSLWSMGALLQARRFLSPVDRERITMEEAIRRQNRASQLRYGEIAIELDLIGREALDECLDQQAALQNLDATVTAGWRGRIVDKHPLWLVCGVGQSAYRDWQEALSRHGLALTAALPFSWLVSDSIAMAASSPQSRRDEVPRIDLELHAEEVVAVLRREDRVVASRSEGRIERAPGADWLNRLVADWAAEPRVQMSIHFLDPADDAFSETLADAITLTTGHPCHSYQASVTRQNLWFNLLREASAPVSRLPRVLARELYGSMWKHPDMRRLLALGGVMLALTAYEGVQRYRLHQVEVKIADRQRAEQESRQVAQQTAQIDQKLVALGKELESTRKTLEPLVNDRTRLSRIVTMQAELPDLLYLLASAVGNDAVLEAVRADSTNSQGSAIQVVAWSPSYTGAQDFVSRISVPARERGFGVSQTEIIERKGRNNRPGHKVAFWLLLEDSDLESNHSANRPAAPLPATPGGVAGGITSQAPAEKAAP